MKIEKVKLKRRKFLSLIIVLNLAVIFHIWNYCLYAKDKSFWLNIGIGPSSFNGYSKSQNDDPGMAGGIIFSYQTGRNLISTRLIYNAELNLFGFSESIWDFGVLYGINSKSSRGLASISGGVGIVQGVRKGKLIKYGWLYSEYEELAFSTIGIPLEIQLFATPFSHVGIGIYGFANLNREKSFAGAMLCVVIGKLREI
jgi:hypothetical protein